ncbi:MAG: hypothetical protein AABY22_23520 [Nanoarchaeota archaeon]
MKKPSNEIKLKKDRRISDWEIIIFALIGVLIFFYFGVMVMDWILQPNYTITKQECMNYTTESNVACKLGCKEGIVSLGHNGFIKEAVLGDLDIFNRCSLCDVIYPIKQNCNKVDVDKIFYISEDCRAHSSNEYEAFFNCVFLIGKKDLNEGWLFSHCECLEAYCPSSKQLCGWNDKTAFYKHCAKWKCKDYEVKVE